MKKTVKKQNKGTKKFSIAKFSKRNKKLVKVLTFLILLNVFSIPLYAIVISGFEFQPLKSLTAGSALFLLRLTGMDASLSTEAVNPVISMPVSGGQWAAVISWDCTGWKSMLALFALVFATPFVLSKKLFGLVLIPLIYIINIARIWFMFFYVNTFGFNFYSIIHSIVWSWGLLVMMLIIWVVWAKFL
jgi:exosortase/archaeosortase family protein